ncbi:MAG: response regulator [Candidatus Altiarchaeota archaeon]
MMPPVIRRQPQVVQPPATGGKPKVLVIDDDKGIRTLLDALLTRNGFDVTLAASGDEGYELFKKAPAGTFAVVLCDRKCDPIHEDRNQGDEVISGIKRIDPSQKVIMGATGASRLSIAEVVAIGADAYVDKPFQIKQLVEKITELTKTKV